MAMSEWKLCRTAIWQTGIKVLLCDDDREFLNAFCDEIVEVFTKLNLKAELSYSSECARCLAPVNGVFSLDFERTVVSEGTISDEQLDEHFDEYAILDKTMLDIDEPLSEEMLLSFPAKLLCSEDCPGLCPKCGKPKREGKCECPEHEMDPRWAALKTFFDEDKK